MEEEIEEEMVEEEEEEEEKESKQVAPQVKKAFADVSPTHTPLNQSMPLIGFSAPSLTPILPFSGNNSAEVTSVQPFKQT